MKALLTDPVFLITCGILVAGIISLIWAIKKWMSMASNSPEKAPYDDMLSAPPAVPDLGLAPPLSFPTVTISGATPPVSKEVADRLDTMSQRLLEMQTVLSKQSAGAPAGAGVGGTATGAVGQGFSPETVEKLLKIIGNVIQQVDTLQKSLNVPK